MSPFITKTSKTWTIKTRTSKACNCQDPKVACYWEITGVAMCEAIDNSNSTCRMILKKHIIK